MRELERVIERAVTLAQSHVIHVDDLPDTVTGRYRDAFPPDPTGDGTMRAWGSRYARYVLERANGNKREACRVLDISYHTLCAYLTYKGPRLRRGRDGEAGHARAGDAAGPQPALSLAVRAVPPGLPGDAAPHSEAYDAPKPRPSVVHDAPTARLDP